jgi:regulator of protease activity HflC (stomatin/prohibitin superfamily)
MSQAKNEPFPVAGFVITFVFILAVLIAGPAIYGFMMELIGRGNLERAKYEKQIQVEQAKAELEAAKLRSEAIMLVGEAAKKYPEYRTQEFIGAFAEAIKDGKIDQIIYVPTEAGIPIVESGRVSGGR